MNWRRGIPWSLIGLTCVLLGSGCGGESNASLSRLQTLTSRNVTAVLQVKRWTDILYRLLSPMQSGPCETEIVPEGPDKFIVTNSDCSVTVYWLREDGSGTGETTFPDGSKESQAWDAPVFTETELTVQVHYLFRNQARMDMTETIFYSGVVRRVGRFYLPDDRSLPYTYERRGQTDYLRLEQEDGQVITLEVPLDSTLGAPDLTQKATGRLQEEAGGLLDFELQRVDAAVPIWDSWSFTTPQGEVGQFALSPDFEGSGQVEQPGEGQAVLAWNQKGLAQLTLTDGSHLTASPAQTALDFVVDQWLHKFGEYGVVPH